MFWFFFNFRYDPLSGIWIEQSPILAARQKFAATVFEDKIFIFGKTMQAKDKLTTLGGGFSQ